MSGTFHTIAYGVALGGSIGIAQTLFHDRPWPLLALAAVTWLEFWHHLADAAWVPSSKEADIEVDRIETLARGLGFALVTIAILSTPLRISVLLAAFGLTWMIFGRACGEVSGFQFGGQLDPRRFHHARSAAKAPTYQPKNPSSGSDVS